MTLQIYGDRVSGNCLKVKWTARKLGIAYRWIQTDVREAQTRTPEFLAMNPAGQVPLVVLEDGRPLAQSNAIILHLARART
jgi:glutathione S-transferase